MSRFDILWNDLQTFTDTWPPFLCLVLNIEVGKIDWMYTVPTCLFINME